MYYTLFEQVMFVHISTPEDMYYALHIVFTSIWSFIYDLFSHLIYLFKLRRNTIPLTSNKIRIASSIASSFCGSPKVFTHLGVVGVLFFLSTDSGHTCGYIRIKA